MSITVTRKVVLSPALETLCVFLLLVPLLFCLGAVCTHWSSAVTDHLARLIGYGMPAAVCGLALSWAWLTVVLWRGLFPRCPWIGWFGFLVPVPVIGPLVVFPLLLLIPAKHRPAPAFRRTLLLVLLLLAFHIQLFALALPGSSFAGFAGVPYLISGTVALLLGMSFSVYPLLAGRHWKPWCRHAVRLTLTVMLICLAAVVWRDRRTEAGLDRMQAKLAGLEVSRGDLKACLLYRGGECPGATVRELIALAGRLDAADAVDDSEIAVHRQPRNGVTEAAVPGAPTAGDAALERKFLSRADLLARLDALAGDGETALSKSVPEDYDLTAFMRDLAGADKLFDLYSLRIADAVKAGNAAETMRLIRLKAALLNRFGSDPFFLGPLVWTGETDFARDLAAASVLPALTDPDRRELDLLLADSERRVRQTARYVFTEQFARHVRQMRNQPSAPWAGPLDGWLDRLFPGPAAKFAAVARLYFSSASREVRTRAAYDRFLLLEPWRKDWAGFKADLPPRTASEVAAGVVSMCEDFSAATAWIRLARTAVAGNVPERPGPAFADPFTGKPFVRTPAPDGGFVLTGRLPRGAALEFRVGRPAGK